ncbi:hypothetical protein TNIN_379741 [Trichonephila inaurata madagascariensis]|uniref:Uncharacterized protein n=1 Tax=Trichonephila inaurata madagascariensis TaxID=2747483 RepID=A0A8X7CHF1_9ARAC|nr:hypothetical protein TNIN_379741 [Trichonephila inaurata madagascariensis]
MASTFCRGRAAVGVRHPFSVEALHCSPVDSWFRRNGSIGRDSRVFCTRKRGNDILPRPRCGECSSPLSVDALHCSPVDSWCRRNEGHDKNPTFKTPLLRKSAFLLINSLVFSARGNGKQRHPAAAALRSVFVTLFRRGTTLQSGRFLVQAEQGHD